MFCPSCGSNEQMSQYCRACGTDLRPVRTTLERPDSITAIAVSAREEIGRAVAQKIREVQAASDLDHVVEEILPEIEKFLESHEEKRLRRVRAGVVMAASGLGIFILGLVLASIIYGAVGQALTAGAAGLGLLMFLVGLGFVLNGLRFTEPRESLDDHSPDAELQSQLDAGYTPPQLKSSGAAPTAIGSQTTSNLAQPSSVTEGTTHHLTAKR